MHALPPPLGRRLKQICRVLQIVVKALQILVIWPQAICLLSANCSILPQEGAPVGAPSPELPEHLLRVRDVAARLNVSAATVYRLAHSGILPVVRVLGSLRFRSKDLEVFISSSSYASRDR